MWKTMFMLLAGVGSLLALTAKGAGANEGHVLLTPNGPFKKIITVEIQGKLRKVVQWIDLGLEILPKDGPGYPMPHVRFVPVTHWEITVQGKTYELELGTKELQSLAEKLDGQTVLLTGRLETRLREHPRWTRGEIHDMKARMPVSVSVVVVGSMQAAPAELVKETVNVVISGKLTMGVHLGYPGRDVQPVITSGGKTYVLDFGANIKGKLDIRSLWMGGRDHEDEPEMRITVNGKTYGLEFADKQALRNLASGLNGKTVVLTGTLELRRTFAGTVWQIVAVDNLRADTGDFVRQTETSSFCCPLVPVK